MIGISIHSVALVLCGMGIFYALCIKSLLWLIYFFVMAGVNAWLINRVMK
jgi:hypothetical protein